MVNRSPARSFTPGDALDGNARGGRTRTRFVRDLGSGQWSMSELCERYGVTRPTGYKWVARHRAGGGGRPASIGVAPRTRGRIGPSARARGADRRGAAASTGGAPRSCCRCCARRYPHGPWPARSTVNALLERHHVAPQAAPAAPVWTHPGAAPVQTDAPESGVAGRFQGPVQDARWRVLLSADRDRSLQPRAPGVSRPAVGADGGTQPVFRALFREVGLPDAIRTDNGAPFASTGLHWSVALECLVDATGDRASADSRRRVRRRRARTNGCIAS